MSDPSRRERAIAAIVARLEEVTRDNGCATDAGAHVIVGETPTLGPDDPPAVFAVVVQEDSHRFQGEHVVSTLPLEIQALLPAGSEDPWLAAEAMVADVKRAVELREEDLAVDDRRRFGNAVQRDGLARGNTRAAPRPEGSSYVGIGITYEMQIRETWGNP